MEAQMVLITAGEDRGWNIDEGTRQAGRLGVAAARRALSAASAAASDQATQDHRAA